LKKIIASFAAGLILATATFAFAGSPIKLFVNGQEIHSDVPPQIINGRTLVPARPLAEALGAKVEWDSASNSVVVMSGQQQQTATATPENQDNVTETTFNGLKAMIIDGVTYFDRNDYGTKFYDHKDFNKAQYGYDKTKNIIIYQLNGIDEQINISKDDVKIYLGRTWIHSKYYREP